MIKNDKQYQVTKRRLIDFEESLIDLDNQINLDPLLKMLQINAIKSQIEDFKKDIREYEALKSGLVNYIYIDSLESLHEALIKGRLAKGFSQGDLAKRLELKEQQIQRYEACNYSTASLPRIIEIANEVGITFPSIKVKLKDPQFNVPENLSQEKVLLAQNKLRERKSLIVVN